MLGAIPNYANLDVAGEARAAAERMEARAREPAPDNMFRELALPLLSEATARVLEVGCGTGALARRIAKAAPQAIVFASDRSLGMLEVAQSLADPRDVPSLHFGQWDVSDEEAFPFGASFDLIVSSVMVPYLDDEQTRSLVRRLSARLAPRGVLAFIEQDLLTDTVNVASLDLFRRVFAKDERRLKQTLALGLRPLLREAGLSLLPRKSFLWTDEAYGPYARELLARLAEDACARGRITEAEQREWGLSFDTLAGADDFFYGLVYHRVAGVRLA